MSDIFQASEKGDISVIEEYIRSNSDVNVVGGWGDGIILRCSRGTIRGSLSVDQCRGKHSLEET